MFIQSLQHGIESGHYKHMMFVYYILTHYNTKKSNNLIDDQMSKDCERLDNNVIREKDAKGLFTLLVCGHITSIITWFIEIIYYSKSAYKRHTGEIVL